MTDRHRVDAHVAHLARISDEQISLLAGNSGREALLEEIMHMSTDQPRPHARRRLRTMIVAAVSVLVVGGTAAASWAIVNRSTRDTGSVQCEVRGSDTIITSTSGNAVTDCAAQWQRETGTAAPKLVAYDNGHGGILVQPADQAAPRGGRKLPGGGSQNVVLIDLQESLDDLVHGLNAGCYNNGTATTKAQADLAALNLTGWTVIEAPASDFSRPASGVPVPAGSPVPARSQQTPSAQCVDTAILDPVARTVSLRALSGPIAAHIPQEKLAAKLRSFTGCTSVDVSAQRVRAVATQLGLSETAHDYQLTEVIQASASCTTIHETVGGTIFITLRGPAN